MENRQEPVTGYRAALHHPIARRLWVATAVSVLGDYVGLAALLLVAHDRAGGVLGSATIFAVMALPGLLSGALGGSWLDQLPRDRAMVMLQLVGAGAISIPLFVGGLAPVLVAAALLGGVRTAMVSLRAAAMAEGVPDPLRGPLLALLNTTEQATQVLGFGTGTTIALLVGTSTALIVDAASFVVGAAVLAQLRLVAPQSRDRSPVTAGIRDIFADPVLRLLAPLVWVTATVGSLPEALASGVARDSAWTPIVFAAGPAGQAITMLIVGRLRQVGRPSVQLTHLAWLALALGVAALGRTPAWFAVSNLLVGSGVAWIIGPQLTFVRRAPRERMAQVTGTMVAVLIAAEGLGTPVFGAIAARTSVPTAYNVAGFLVLGAAVVGWVLKERTPAALALDDDRSLARRTAPDQ